MNKKLSIILPQYSEDENICYPCLNSLNSQMFCNFDNYEFIIVNDCSDVKLSEEYLKSFTNLDIKYISTEVNSGPGVARQTGLDIAQGEYVMFIDIDDCLFHNCVFMVFETEIYPKQENITITEWVELKDDDNGQYSFIKHGLDAAWTWVFGKFIKRQFLVENDIRFHPNLRVHEDTYFNLMCKLHNDLAEVTVIEFPCYIWCLNTYSITRVDNNFYNITSLATYIYSLYLIMQYYNERAQIMPEAVQAEICDFYYLMHQKECTEERAQPWVAQAEKMAAHYINTCWSYVSALDEESWANSHKRAIKYCNHTPTESFPDWLQRLKNMNITELPEFISPNININKVTGEEM